MTKCNTVKGAQPEKGFQAGDGTKVEIGGSGSIDFEPVSLIAQHISGAGLQVRVSGVESTSIDGQGTFDLRDNDLHLWTADVSVFSSAREFIFDQILLSDEVARGSRFKFSKDRDLFVSARATLRLLLAQYLNIGHSEIFFAAGVNGKPLLSVPNLSVGLPLDFNVSHSGGRVLIGVSRSDVGVDIEQVEFDRNYDAIAKRYFSEFERNTIASLNGQEKSRAFYDTWSRKEAFLKALGIGLSDHLDGFDVEAHPGREASVLAVRATGGEWGDEKPENWIMYDLKVDKDYAATAVVRTSKSGTPVRVMAMDIANLIII